MNYQSIALSGKRGQGLYALVDDPDLKWLTEHSWSYSNTGYARCTIKCKQYLMHNLIMGEPPPGYMVDHVNQDKLDNRRENLRFVTKSQNMQNTSKKKNNTSTYKGVYFLKSGNRNKRWFAKLVVNSVVHQSAYVDTKEEAVELYEQLSTKHQGNFKPT